MPLVRPLLLVLALGTLASMTLHVDVAHAQAPAPMFAAPGVLEVLPAGDLVGDGQSPVTMRVVALDPDGNSLTGLDVKATASAGSAEGWSSVGPGMYEFKFTPPKVSTATVATLSLKGRTATRENVSATIDVAVRPPLATGLTITANPPAIVLGQDTEATLSFTIEGAQGVIQPSDLKVFASSGEITNLTHMGSGRFTARFTAPKVNFPQLAIVTAADRRDPSRVFGSAVIPLQGKTAYPVRATPNATVILRIAGREFGPVQAGATGAAQVPVIVPPGVNEATQVSVVNGTTSEQKIDLRVPETRRIRMLPLNDGVPATGTLEIPVRVAVFTGEGKPDPMAAVDFTATGGSVGPAKHDGNGVYVTQFKPRLGNSVTVGSITATVRGSSVQTDTIQINLLPSMPGSLKLDPQPPDLDEAATSFKLFAKVLDPAGAGMANRNLAFLVAGATQAGAVQDLKNGDYRADFTTEGKTSVEVVAGVVSPSANNPLRRVVVFPMQPGVVNDGLGTNLLTVVTLDEFGLPVPSVAVGFKVESGDGTVPASVTTNANGLGQLHYTAGRKPGVVRIRAVAGPHTAGTAFFQMPKGVATPKLAISGNARDVAIANAWRGVVAHVHIPRAGSAAALGTAGPSGPTGMVTSLSARAEPSMVAPGGVVTLRVKALDGEGRGVAGQALELIASNGEFAAVSDLGGGEYEVGLRVPGNAQGEIKISVANSSGSASTFLKVPVSGEPVAVVDPGQTGWGTTDPGTGTVTDPGTGTVTDPGTPVIPGPEPVDSEHPWLRMRASFVASIYRYEQQPLTTQGPLIPRVLAVGGQNGDKSATPLGAEIAAKGWLESVPYFGFDARFRFSSYAITATEFEGQSAPDTLYDVRADLAGRYPFDVGGNRFHVGVRAGFLYNDFIVFQGEIPGTIEFTTLALPGLGLSAEIGAEVGPVYFNAGVTEGLYYFSKPYSTAVDVNLGVDLTDNLFLDAGFSLSMRDLQVVGDRSGAPVGELSDGQTMFKVGVGWAM